MILMVLGWMAFGLVVGLLAKVLVPGRDPGGLVVTILIGIAGAFVGGFIARSTGIDSPGKVVNFTLATIGAILLLFMFRLAARLRIVRDHHSVWGSGGFKS